MIRQAKAIALVAGLLAIAVSGIGAPAAAQSPTVMTIFAAGTLAGPFRALDAVFEKQYPNVVVRLEFGGSVMMAKRQLGEIDYLGICRSDAIQHHLNHLALPAAIDLSDPRLAKLYATAVVHTKNGAVTGPPIVYAATIPNNAPHADWAQKYLALLLGPQGRKIMQDSGFAPVAHLTRREVRDPGVVPGSCVTAEIEAEAIHVFPAAGTTRRGTDDSQWRLCCYAFVRRLAAAGAAASRFFAVDAGCFGARAARRAVAVCAVPPFGRAAVRAISASACNQWTSALSAGRPSPSQIA